MATRQPSEHEDRDQRKQDDGQNAPSKDAPDPANDPRRDQRRDKHGDKDEENRLPSSALTPDEKHDRDIEDLKKAGHDFKGPKVDKDPDADPEDPQLRTVTVEDHRTRRDDGIDAPPVPGTGVDVSTLHRDPSSRAPTFPPGARSAMENPAHPLHYAKDA